MKKLKYALIITNCAVVAGVVIFLIFSKMAMDADMRCALAENAHIYCPGCGGTRALYSLLKLDFLSSLRYNIAVPFIAGVYVYYNIKAIIALVKKDEGFISRQKFIPIYIFIGILILNFLVRNILLWCFGIDFIGDILPRHL